MADDKGSVEIPEGAFGGIPMEIRMDPPWLRFEPTANITLQDLVAVIFMLQIGVTADVLAGQPPSVTRHFRAKP